jgi:hypothetical protein
VEEENQDQDLLAGIESPPNLTESAMQEDETLPPYEDDVVGLDSPGRVQTFETPGWGFNRLNQQQRVPAPSEDGMFDDKGSSNDSTRVEGLAGSPARSSLPEEGDLMYSEAAEPGDEYGSRGLRESAPPPELPGMDVDYDEDDPPVVELKADPGNNDELTFHPATK